MIKELVNRFKSGGLVLFDQGLVSGTSFVTGVLLARFLGLDGYGEFVLLWMLVLFALSLAQAIITKPMLSMLPKMPQEDVMAYQRSLYAMQCGLSLVTIVVSIFFLYLSSLFDWSFALSFAIIWRISTIAGLFLLYDFFRKSFFVNNDLKFPIILDTLLAVSQIGGLFLLYYFDRLSLVNTLTIILGTYSLITFLAAQRLPRPDWRWASLKLIWDRHFDFSKWLLGTALLQWLCGNFFILAGGAILGTTMVGAVRMAQNVVGLIHVLFLAMENLVPVYASQHYEKGGIEALLTYLRKVSLQIGSLVMGLLLILGATAPWIIEFLYGSEYMEYSYVLVGFCLIYLFVFVSYPLRFALRTLEMTRPIFMGYVFGALFSLLMAYPLLQSWQLYGLLMGLWMTQVIALLIYIISLTKLKNVYENHTLDTRQSES